MKRCLSFFLCALMLFASGCAYAAISGNQDTDSYDLYFLEADLESSAGGGAFRAEPIFLDEEQNADTQQIVEALLAELLEGPLDETLKSPFPAGTALLSVEVNGSRALVDLSAAYSTLSGVGLTLADYSIALTLTQLPDILSVKITVRGQELAYRDKQIFTAQEVLLTPEEDVVGTVQAMLYFLDEDGRLMAEKRTLDLYEGDTQVTAVAQAVESGPESKKLSAVLPENFRVRSVWQEEGVCYVNLSSGLLEDLPDSTMLPVAIQALARSLCSLDAVSEVRFLVDGEFAQNYGPVSIAEPFAG